MMTSCWVKQSTVNGPGRTGPWQHADFQHTLRNLQLANDGSACCGRVIDTVTTNANVGNVLVSPIRQLWAVQH